MVDWTISAFVFVYDGKCRTIDLFGHTELLADGFDEGGFARAHLSVEGK